MAKNKQKHKNKRQRKQKAEQKTVQHKVEKDLIATKEAEENPEEACKKERKKLLTTCPEGQVNIQFTPIDTWFFRESRPHDAAGASELSSLFPPPVRALAGAMRHFLGETLHFDWSLLKQPVPQKQAELEEFMSLLGTADSLSPLSVRGAWVCQYEMRMYPVPFYLMHKDNQDLTRLKIGSVVECDLGKVRLAEFSDDSKKGYKNYDQAWLTHKGWAQLLNDETPKITEIIKQDDLFSSESRLGIARNNQTRTVMEGMLYQTQHLRLAEGISIELDMLGLADKLMTNIEQEENSIVRLGGEGRMAALNIQNEYPAPPKIKDKKQILTHFIIHFITAADFAGKMFPLLSSDDSDKSEDDFLDESVWQGHINGINIEIVSAVIGKVHREGGWDMQKHVPRAVKSYIPAGSAWFCRALDQGISAEKIIDALHDKCIGDEQDLGRGHILIGLWNDNIQQGENNGNS